MSQTGKSSIFNGPKALVSASLFFVVALTGIAGDEKQTPAADVVTVIPVESQMRYSVSYGGIHCGSLTLESFEEDSADGPVFRIVMTAATSKFFDAIYKVRSRIESVYDPRRMSTIRYHEHSVEKKKVMDKLYVVDFDASQVRRLEGDEEKIIPIESDQVYDPLAFLYRARRLVGRAGDRITLNMVTSDGDLPTVAEVVEKKKIQTPFGKREAMLVVPRPVDEEMFSKKGTMNVWLSTDDRRIPYRIEFDLSFGRLVAKLKEIEGQDR